MQHDKSGVYLNRSSPGGLELGASEGLIYVCSSFLTKCLSSGILFL
jgi:hypothetical protein